MTRLVAIDVGGTNARFAVAEIGGGGTVLLGETVTLATDDFAGIEAAWEEFAERRGEPLPHRAAVAIAGPVDGGTVRMTNNRWEIDAARLRERLGLDAVILLNDFAATAHAAASLGEEQFVHLSGPGELLPAEGTISVVGPGTGLGIAHFHRSGGGYRVQATEGGHIGFAPCDEIDDAILARMRARYGRVSVERVVSGPGIDDIYAVLAGRGGHSAPPPGDLTIWRQGREGSDPLSSAAVERFCVLLGRAAGDYALAHGASGVVIAGGLGLRLRDVLPQSGFAAAFRDKGRYEAMMAAMPVKLLVHPQPGLYGAAVAFAASRD